MQIILPSPEKLRLKNLKILWWLHLKLGSNNKHATLAAFGGMLTIQNCRCGCIRIVAEDEKWKAIHLPQPRPFYKENASWHNHDCSNACSVHSYIYKLACTEYERISTLITGLHLKEISSSQYAVLWLSSILLKLRTPHEPSAMPWDILRRYSRTCSIF